MANLSEYLIHSREMIRLSMLKVAGNFAAGCNTQSGTILKISRHSRKLTAIEALQGWRSGESTRLPPLWPGFDSQIRRHMRVEFVGSLLCSERFSAGTPVSPFVKNHHLT